MAEFKGPINPDEGLIGRLKSENKKLQAFKDYVHKRLDEAGVPVDPESPHKDEGCRIGGRLDWVFALPLSLAAKVSEIPTPEDVCDYHQSGFEAGLKAAVQLIYQLHQQQEPVGDGTLEA